ncbi:MAG: dihydroorotase, partial [Ilumatobacter sp.]|nr:dihydroorotase [Ilumatobacter sp.]
THGRPVAPGEPANLTVFDPAESWHVVPAELASKSRNTPFVGLALKGKVKHTLLHGEPTVLIGAAQR